MNIVPPARRHCTAHAIGRAALALCAAARLASAQAGPAADPDCAAAASTQAAMNACAHDDFVAANVDYAERYRALSQPLAAAQRERLRRMQTAWIGYRTAACRFESGPVSGGSAYDFVYWQCAARMTRERSGQLDAMAHCREGDLACAAQRP